MNLLQYANTCAVALDNVQEKEFAQNFVSMRVAAFNMFHDGLIISNSHGISYFQNIARHWDNPVGYIDGLTEKEIEKYAKQKDKSDYEKNFVLVLINNKNKK